MFASKICPRMLALFVFSALTLPFWGRSISLLFYVALAVLKFSSAEIKDAHTHRLKNEYSEGERST